MTRRWTRCFGCGEMIMRAQEGGSSKKFCKSCHEVYISGGFSNRIFSIWEFRKAIASAKQGFKN